MKKLFIPVIMLTLIIFFIFGCPAEEKERTIKEAISDFQKAVNANDVKEIEDVLSPDSDFYITRTFKEFLDLFDDFRDVEYTNLSITKNPDGTADVIPTATYDNGLLPVNVLFVMKKESSSPDDWKVLQYWDDADGSFDFLWKKLQLKKLQQQER